MADLTHVERLVGAWDIPLGDASGTMTLEPVLAGTAFLQRSTIPVPSAPEALSIIAVDQVRDRLLMHYFDDRGVTRLYVMTIDEDGWTLTRDEADFTRLPFRQRFSATFEDGGDTIRGRWERTDPGPDGDWMIDFDLVYRRRAGTAA